MLRPLYINEDAGNIKSREHLLAVDSHVQQPRRPKFIRYEHPTPSFPWQRRRRNNEVPRRGVTSAVVDQCDARTTDEAVSAQLPVQLESTSRNQDWILDFSLIIQHREAPAPVAFDENLSGIYTLAPLVLESQVTSFTSAIHASLSSSILPLLQAAASIHSFGFQETLRIERGICRICVRHFLLDKARGADRVT
jgi:hypothetical protein